MSGDVDAVSRLDPCRPLYLEVVDQIEALAGRADVLGGALVDRLVPACPSWTGRDVLGHLTGIAQDWVAGRLEGYASKHWTAEQVACNAQLSLPNLMAAWRTAVGELGTTHHPQMGAPWRWLFGDALIHEADLYDASGLGGGPPKPAIQVAFGQIVGRWRREVVGASAESPWPGLVLVDPAGDCRSTKFARWTSRMIHRRCSTAPCRSRFGWPRTMRWVTRPNLVLESGSSWWLMRLHLTGDAHRHIVRLAQRARIRDLTDARSHHASYCVFCSAA